jgi:membrane-associated phospholipid phosphatase
LWNFHLRKLFWWLLPVALLLVASTVYIKAHYLIDVFAGLLVAPLFYVFSVRIWGKMSENKWLL